MSVPQPPQLASHGIGRHLTAALLTRAVARRSVGLSVSAFLPFTCFGRNDTLSGRAGNFFSPPCARAALGCVGLTQQRHSPQPTCCGALSPADALAGRLLIGRLSRAEMLFRLRDQNFSRAWCVVCHGNAACRLPVLWT